ncbi:MAG: replication protein [Dehalococcoidia bacterium]
MKKIGTIIAPTDIERFKGFASPNTTPTPDDLFDRFLAELNGAELKVLLYIVRRTFGFKKEGDTISLSQLSDGIKTRDGKQLDRGTGLSKSAVKVAVKSLEKRGLITVTRQEADGYNSVNAYSLRFQEKRGG